MTRLIPEPSESKREIDNGGAEDPRGDGLVLVVDDEEAVLEVLASMLEAAGFSPVTAGSGEEAVGLFKDKPGDFKAILLDLTMPGMDGKEALAEIRRIRGDVPVILISGYDEQDVTGRFPGGEISGFIQKPFNQSALTRTLCRVIDPGE